MTRTIVLAGSPTALGGHFGGMERSPAALRAHGLLAALRARPGLADAAWRDAGDATNDPGWVADDDARAKNRERIVAFLGRLTEHVAGALGDAVGRAAGDAAAGAVMAANEPPALLVVGGDCTTHDGAVAGLRRARPGIRLGVAWFDAHGDFNTPETTPSGNVWGMPFAMLCGRGAPDLLAACDAPSVREADAALLGGQVLDETESRMLAAGGVAQFGAGMLADPAGLAALTAWARTVAGRVDAWYIAFDLDALDASGGWAVAMPEPGGLSLDDAATAVRAIAGTGPVAGFGATAAMLDAADPAATERTIGAIAVLAEAALA
jgi:arginase